MEENDQIKSLQEQLNSLLRKQNALSHEIVALKEQVSKLSSGSSTLADVNVALSFLFFVIFLSQGQLMLSSLREAYIAGEGSLYHLWIRYISILFSALLIFINYLYTHKNPAKSDLKVAFDGLFYLSTLVLMSSELIHWLDLYGFNDSYKLGLSILWGVTALLWIVTGILKRKKYLRVGAIVLFGVTLIKLFFYDISHLSTLSKTVVFLSLGILLLVISFFYNKFKDLAPRQASG